MKEMSLKMSSAKWRPFCLCFNVLNNVDISLKVSSGIQLRAISLISNICCEITLLNVLTVLPEDNDFKGNKQDASHICKQITSMYKYFQINNIHTVDRAGMIL